MPRKKGPEVVVYTFTTPDARAQGNLRTGTALRTFSDPDQFQEWYALCDPNPAAGSITPGRVPVYPLFVRKKGRRREVLGSSVPRRVSDWFA